MTWTQRACVMAVTLAILFALGGCSNDSSTVYDGDNQEAIKKLQLCVNTGGTPIMHSADGGLYVYCIYKQGR